MMVIYMSQLLRNHLKLYGIKRRRDIPIMVKMPHNAHTTKDILTLPVEARTPVGETNIPLPI